MSWLARRDEKLLTWQCLKEHLYKVVHMSQTEAILELPGSLSEVSYTPYSTTDANPGKATQNTLWRFSNLIHLCAGLLRDGRFHDVTCSAPKKTRHMRDCLGTTPSTTITGIIGDRLDVFVATRLSDGMRNKDIRQPRGLGEDQITIGPPSLQDT